MLQEIAAGFVVAGAGYWILRRILRQLAGDDGTDGCQGCSGCSVPHAREPGALPDTGGACPSAGCRKKHDKPLKK